MGAYAQAVLADHPLVWWRMSESIFTQPAPTTWWGGAPGTSYVANAVALVHDSCGGNSGYVYGNSTVLSVPGPTGVICETGCQFDGVDGTAVFPYIQGFPAWPSVTPAAVSSLSVELWFQRTSGSSTAVLVGNDTPASSHVGWELSLVSGTTPTFTIGHGGTSSSAAAAAVSDANWHHLVGTFDGTHVVIYLDGAATTTTISSASIAATSNYLQAAATVGATGSFFAGSLAQIAVYSTVLSSTRVTAHHAAVSVPLQQQWPTVSVWVAFDNLPTDDPAHFTVAAQGASPAAGEWTDLSQTVYGYTTNRGRQYETDQFTPGTATVTFDNTVGNFNPWNTGGPYVGQLVPRKWLQIRANGIPRFTGHTTEWDPEWPDPFSLQAQVVASDPLRFANACSVAGDLYYQAATSDLPTGATLLGYMRLDETGGTVAADVSGNSMAAFYFGDVAYSQPGALDADIDSGIFCNGGGVTVPSAFTVGLAGTDRELVGAWFNITSTTTAAPGTPLITLANGYGLYELNGILNFLDSGGENGGIFDQVINDGQWHFLALVNGPPTSPLQGWFTFPSIVSGNTVIPNPAQYGILTNNVVLSGLSDPRVTFGDPSFVGSIDEITAYQMLAADVIIDGYPLLFALQVAALGYLPQQTTGQRVESANTISNSPLVLRPFQIQADPGFTQVSVEIGINVTAVGTSLLGYMQQCEASEQGALFCDSEGYLDFYGRQSLYSLGIGVSELIVGDNPPGSLFGTEAPYQAAPTIALDDLHIFNDASAAGFSGNTLRVVNPTSVDKYGHASWQPAASLLTLNDSDVGLMLDWVVFRYSDPQTRLTSFEIDLTDMINDVTQAPNLNVLLGSDLLAPVTVLRHTLDFLVNGFLEQISETVTPEQWAVTLAVGPQDPNLFSYAQWDVNGSWDNDALWAY